MRALMPCGTRAAYRRHLYNREVTCELCREAARIYDHARDRAGRRGPLEECWCCGRDGWHGGRGLCVRCHRRWQSRGFTGPGPGPEWAPAADRAREYADVITSLSARRAAEELGKSARTVTRWRKLLQAAS